MDNEGGAGAKAGATTSPAVCQQVVRPRGGRSGKSTPPDIVGDAGAPLIPEGRYHAVGGEAREKHPFGVRKLELDLTVLVPDPETSETRCVLLTRYYNLPKRGERLGRSSHYWREWVLVTGRAPTKSTPMSPDRFNGVLMEVEVRTVRNDSRQEKLAGLVQYSKVARILGVLAGGKPAGR